MLKNYILTILLIVRQMLSLVILTKKVFLYENKTIFTRAWENFIVQDKVCNVHLTPLFKKSSFSSF